MDAYLRKMDRRLLPILIVLTLYISFMVLQLSRNGHDITSFVSAGTGPLIEQDLASQKLTLGVGAYDGIFYYRLAVDPFTNKHSDLGITFDYPAYRQQRILYPLLAWVVSLGNINQVPYALVLVNIVSLCLLAYLGSTFAVQVGKHPIFGLVFPLYAGCLLSFSRDLAEVVEISLIMATILLLNIDRPKYAVFTLTAAVLTRETAIVIAFSGILAVILNSKNRLKPRSYYIFVIPIIVYIGWQLILKTRWTAVAINNESIISNFSIPFMGFIQALERALLLRSYVDLLHLGEYVLIIIFTISVLVALRNSTTIRLVKIAWLLYIVMMLCFSSYVWEDDWSFVRVLCEMFMLGYVIVLTSKFMAIKSVFLVTGLSWAFLAINLLRFR